MADTHVLNESMIVSEEGENGGDGGGIVEVGETPEAAAVEGASKKARAKRASVKSVEGRVAALEQRVETLAQEPTQLTRMTEQLVHLEAKIANLEESLAARSSNGGGTSHGGEGIADQVRQLDERLQKLAYMLAQQNWNRI